MGRIAMNVSGVVQSQYLHNVSMNAVPPKPKSRTM